LHALVAEVLGGGRSLTDVHGNVIRDVLA